MPLYLVMVLPVIFGQHCMGLYVRVVGGGKIWWSVLSARVLWFRLCGWLFDAEGDDAWGIGLMGQISGFFLL